MLTPGRTQHSTRSSRPSTVSAKESTHSDQASQAAARMLIPALGAPPLPHSSSGPLPMEVPAVIRQGYHSTPRPTLIDTGLYLVRLFTCRYSRDDSSSRP